MVPVSVDRPVGNEEVWGFGSDDCQCFVIAGGIEFGGPIGLGEEERPRVEDPAGFLGLGGPYAGRLLVAFAADARLTPVRYREMTS